MVRWGASVADADRETLVRYLATHFAPAAPAPPMARDDGAASFDRACLGCHGVDLVAEQRLSVAGWTREVEKMMRWGAPLAESEKDALAAYLAARYPVR